MPLVGRTGGALRGTEDPLGAPQRHRFGRRCRRPILVQQSCLGLRQRSLRKREDYDDLRSARGPRDSNFVAGMDGAMRLSRGAVHVDLAGLARALRFGPRLEKAGNVEPHVETDVARRGRIVR